ncbi:MULTISPECIES: MXAN_6640 family putative metalloprotease [unclassified Nocardioides]|uniref:MXAN_6640 family putative metalloprotease n=1 Tax=unclassified Nocardioides TaxID=2615069 RepID=UPI0005A2C540|nr:MULTISPECIES: MXAN_6640 family putative metalloprotease [unclassified Nocardioides]
MSIHRLHTRFQARLVVPACLAVLLTGGLIAGLPAASGAPGDPSGAAGKTTASRTEARAALADARAVLAGDAAPAADATMTLLRLWQLRGELTGADRAAADRLLSRPDATQDACTADNCYHWVTTGPDAVPTGDLDGDGVPDYVQDVMDIVDGVHDTYVGAGYRAPKTDGAIGGSPNTDIYLADVGSDNLYGYCTSDAPNPPSGGPYDAWAYCVLDNDYDPSQFPTNTPLENLQVTAAHEYFHAVQFGYDALEDSWLMEATATWAEDELYDDVNDNLQYLSESPLKKPGQPLDTFNDAGAQYGTWIFFRFLTEWATDAEGGMPTLVRDIWRYADGAAGGQDDYSMQALSRVLAERGSTLPVMLATFATANRAPALWYDEGAANHYPVAAPGGTFRLSTSKKDSGWKAARLAHLSSVTARFVPGTGLGSSTWKLKVTLDLPDAATKPAAVVTVYPKAGAPTATLVPLSSSGAGTRKVAFGSTRVKYVEVTLVNAGSRYDCWTGGAYSCQGSSLDDGRKVLMRAQAVR